MLRPAGGALLVAILAQQVRVDDPEDAQRARDRLQHRLRAREALGYEPCRRAQRTLRRLGRSSSMSAGRHGHTHAKQSAREAAATAEATVHARGGAPGAPGGATGCLSGDQAPQRGEDRATAQQTHRELLAAD